MNTVTDLTGVATGKPFNQDQGQRVSVHHEHAPGSFVTIGLGADGLVVHHAGTGIGIALADLVNLAGQCSPELASILVDPAKAPPVIHPTAQN